MQDDVLQLRNQVESLKRLNSGLKADHETLAVALDAAESDLVVANAMLAKLRKASAQTEQGMKADMRQLLEQSERSLAAMSQEKEMLQREVETLRATDSSALVAHLEAAKRETASLKSDLASVLSDDERLIQELTKKEAALQSEMKRLAMQHSDVERKLAAEVSRLKDEKAAAERSRAESEREMQRQVESIKAEASQREMRMARELEAAKAHATQAVEAERRLVRELDAAKADKAAMEMRLQRQIEAMKSEWSEAERRIEDVAKSERNEFMKRMQTERDSQRHELQEKADAEKRAIRDAESARTELEQQQRRAQREADDLKRTVREMEREVASLRRAADDDMAALRRELDAATLQVASLTRAGESAASNEAKMKRDLEAALAQNVRLAAAEAGLKQDLAEALRRMDELVERAEHSVRAQTQRSLPDRRDDVIEELRREVEKLEHDRVASDKRLQDALARLQVAEQTARQSAEAIREAKQRASAETASTIDAKLREAARVEADLKRDLADAQSRAHAFADKLDAREKEMRELSRLLSDEKRAAERLSSDLVNAKSQFDAKITAEETMKRDMAALLKQGQRLSEQLEVAERAAAASQKALEQEQRARKDFESASRREVDNAERLRRDDARRMEAEKTAAVESVKRQMLAVRVDSVPSTPLPLYLAAAASQDAALIAGLKRELADALRVAEDFGQRCVEAEKERDAVRAQLNRVSDLEAREESLKRNLREKDAALDVARRELSRAEGELANATASVESLRIQVKAADAELQAEREMARKSAIDSVESTEALRRELSESKASLESCQRQMRRTMEEHANHSKDSALVESLRSQLKAVEDDANRRLAEEESVLLQQRNVQARQIADLNRQLAAVERSREELLGEVERARTSEAACMRMLQAAKREHQTAQEAQKLEQVGVAYHSDPMLETLRNELREAELSQRKVAADLDASKRECSRLNAELIDALRDVERMEAESLVRGSAPMVSSSSSVNVEEITLQKRENVRLSYELSDALNRLRVTEDQLADLGEQRRRKEDSLGNGLVVDEQRMDEVTGELRRLQSELRELDLLKREKESLEQTLAAERNRSDQAEHSLAEAKKLLGAALLKAKDGPAAAQLQRIVEQQEAEILKLRRLEQDRSFYGQNDGAKLKALEESLESSVAEAGKWKRRVGQVEKELAEGAQVKEQLAAAVSEAQSLVREWERRALRTEQELNKTSDDRKKSVPQMEALSLQVTELAKARAELQEELSSVQLQCTARVDALKKERDAIAHELEQSKQAVRDGLQQVDDLRKQLTEHEARTRSEVSGLKREISRLESAGRNAVEFHGREMALLKTRAQSVEENLEEERKRSLARFADFEKRIKLERDKEAEFASRSIVHVERDCEDCRVLQGQNTVLRETVALLEEAKSGSEMQITQLRQTVSAVQEQFSNSELQATSRMQHEHAAECAGLREQIASLTRTVAYMEQWEQRRKATEKSLRKELRAVETGNDGAVAEELRRDLAQALQLAEEFGNRLEEVEAARDRLQHELEMTSTTCGQCPSLKDRIASLETLLKQSGQSADERLRVELEAVKRVALAEQEALKGELERKNEELRLALSVATNESRAALLQRYDAHVQQLNDTIANHVAETERLRAEVSRLTEVETMMQTVMTRRKEEASENNAALRQCEQHKQEVGVLKRSLELMEQSEKDQMASVQRSNAVMEEAERRHKELHQAQLHRLAETMAANDAEISKLASDSNGDAALRRECEQLRKEVATLKHSLELMEESEKDMIALLQRSNARLEESGRHKAFAGPEKSPNGHELDGLKEEIASLKRSLEIAEQSDRDGRVEIDALVRQCKSLKSELAAALEESARLRESVARFEEGHLITPDEQRPCPRCGILKAEIDALKDDVRLKGQPSAASQYEAQLRSQVELLSGELDAARAGSEKLVNVLVEKEDTIVSLQRATEAAQQRETERLRELDLLTERLSNLEAQSETLRRRVAEQAVQLQEEKDSGSERLHGELELLRKRSEEEGKCLEARHEARVQLLEAEKRELREKLETLQENASVAKKDVLAKMESERRDLLESLQTLQDQADSAKQQLVALLENKALLDDSNSAMAEISALLARERDTEGAMRMLITELQQRLFDAESKLFMLSE